MSRLAVAQPAWHPIAPCARCYPRRGDHDCMSLGNSCRAAACPRVVPCRGVDYMKVDGCGPASYYEQGYKAMGAALQASGRPIEYSCSWPAYINHGNESLQPFATFIEYGCNGWRNWHDIGCSGTCCLTCACAVCRRVDSRALCKHSRRVSSAAHLSRVFHVHHRPLGRLRLGVAAVCRAWALARYGAPAAVLRSPDVLHHRITAAAVHSGTPDT